MTWSRRTLAALLTLVVLVLSCAPAAPAPTPASAKPAESKPAAPPTAAQPTAAQPAAPAAQPTAAPVAVKPTAAPAVKVPPPPAVKPAKLDKVTVGVIAWNSWFWIPMLAEAKKLMEPYGIDLEILMTRTVPGQAQAIASGSVDIGAIAPTGAWTVQEKATDFKQIMMSVYGNGYTFVVQPEIKTFQDMKGKTLGAQSQTVGADIETMRFMLLQQGLQFPRDFDIVVSGTVADRTAAMLANQVQGIGTLPPDTFELLDRGKRALAVGWEYPALQDQIVGVFLTRKQWYTEKRDVAIRFVQAYAASTAWIYDPKNRAEAVRILSEQTKMKPEWAERTYEQFVVQMKVYALNPQIDKRRLEVTFANAKSTGQSVPENPMSLVDNSLVEEALGLK